MTTITNLMWRLIHNMATALTPAVSSLDAAGRRESVADVLLSGTKYCLAVASMFCLVPLPVLPDVFGLWLGKEFAGLDRLILVSMLTSMLICIATPPQLVLMGLGKVGVAGPIMLARGVGGLALAWLVLVFVSPSLTATYGTLNAAVALGSFGLFLHACDVVKLPKLSGTVGVLLWPIIAGGLGALVEIPGPVRLFRLRTNLIPPLPPGG